MQNPQIVTCDKCDVLLDLYDKVNCSIANLIKNQWNAKKYGVSLYFDGIQYEDLLHYKKILYRKITNPANIDFCTSDLVTLITKSLYKINKCPKCPC